MTLILFSIAVILVLVCSIYAGIITISFSKDRLKSDKNKIIHSVKKWLASHKGSKLIMCAGYVMRFSYKSLRFVWRMAKRIFPLEDQVKRAQKENGYDFNELFEYTRKYIQSADLSIGVFERPMAGAEAGYSTSNYADGKDMALNFPDEFGEAVRDAGFGLVTTANNHLLDKGKNGALRTLDVMDRIGLAHTGSYRSPEEKTAQRVKLIERGGLKFAFLSYTFYCNGRREDEMIDSEELRCLTSMLADPSGPNFTRILEAVKDDFRLAKSMNPDFIVVLPHMGTQFLKKPDNYQLKWAEIFRELGADIILGCHTHSVQPAEIIRGNDGRNVYTLYCPGNYTNIYREYNGDANILAEVYIDRAKKEVIAGSIILMWTSSYISGNYRPIPLNDIAENKELASRMTTYDLERAEEICRIISGTIFEHEFGFDMVRERWHFNEGGFMREMSAPLDVDSVMMSGRFLSLLNSAKSVCFVGDSVTMGSHNGGYPYYEPLTEHISADICSFAWGGGVVKTLIEHADKIAGSNADLYVIAIGTNDVRYCNPKICAMTPAEYVSSLATLESLIRAKNPGAKFAYIAPWWSDDGDPYTPLKYHDKLTKNESYSHALKEYCGNEGHEYFDVNEYISRTVQSMPARYYLNDHIHPNSKRGIYLYSKALLLSN